MAEYTKALQISPENLAALSNLAWLLATSSDPTLRNGSEAVRLAERADSASSRSDNHPTVLRILAAAYAEAGQFAEAKETAQHALQAANIQGNTTLSDALREKLHCTNWVYRIIKRRGNRSSAKANVFRRFPEVEPVAR